MKVSCKEDKKAFLRSKCESIEQYMARNQSRQMFDGIKTMTKSVKPRLSVIKDANGIV